MLFCMYQVFSSLLCHLHFFVHFLFIFMEQFFIGHPIFSLIHMIFASLKTDTHLRNPNKLLSNLQYSDAIAEAEAAGYDFPPSTTESLQQAIIAFSRLENPDDEVVELKRMRKKSPCQTSSVFALFHS